MASESKWTNPVRSVGSQDPFYVILDYVRVEHHKIQCKGDFKLNLIE